MNGYLRQSTASQSRLIGPFLDDTDFKTAETALTIANTDIKLRANGTTLANKNSGGGTHQVNGMYSVTWDATDSANVGELYGSVVVAGALPVFFTYAVLEEAVYDALFAASAAGFGVAQTGDNFARLGAPAGASVSADVAGVKGDTAAILVDTGTTLDARIPAALVSGRIDASVGAMAAGVVTAAAVATDAIDADALAANAVTEIQAGLATPTNITAGVITTVTNLTNAPTAGDLTATMKASVNAEAVDALNVDTYAEPAQGAPGTTISLAAKLNFLYKAWRNRNTQTATEYALYADNATTKDHEAVVSDDGTTFDRGEIGTGA